MSETTIFSDSFLAMETPCDVVLPNVDAETARSVFYKVKTEVERLEEKLNRFLPDSEVSQLCASPINTWLSVDDELWQLLTTCYDFYELSNGAFDITVAPLVSMYEENENPTPEEIEDQRKLCGFDKLEFDFDKQKIKFLHKNVEFDFGALQKGWALDRIKPLLAELKITEAIVSFGEDTVLAIGKHPTGNEWPIGIRNQLNPMEFIHVFPASDQIVTSFGSMEKVGMEAEMAKSYTISPATGEVINDKRTVSVKSSSGLVGAFVATCWLILSENDRTILSENFKAIEIFETKYLDNDIATKSTILN